MPESAKTLAESAFMGIRGDILSCRLPPGHWLKLDRLRETYGVSLSPLREALSRLVSTGLVTAEGQRGFRVAQVSVNDLLDLTRTRIAIEIATLRSAISVGDRDWEAEIIAAEHRLGTRSLLRSDAPSPELDAQWEVDHRAFHCALVAASPFSRLLRAREQLFDESDRYRRLAVSKNAPNRDVAAEHRAIVGAVLARNADEASNLMQEHLLATTRRALEGEMGATETERALVRIRHDVGFAIANKKLN